MRRNDVDLDGTGVARVPPANLTCVAVVTTGYHSRMPQEDATAECHSKLSHQDVTVGCRSRMSQQDVAGRRHSRMSQQDVPAGCPSSMSQEDVISVNHSNQSQQHRSTMSQQDVAMG